MGKICKEQLKSMQLRLTFVESDLTVKQNNRTECSRKIANLKKSLTKEIRKLSALDANRDKLAQEAIDLKIGIQNLIVGLGRK